MNDSHIKSAIIGMWRMGATPEHIAGLLDIKLIKIELIIQQYQSKTKEHEKRA